MMLAYVGLLDHIAPSSYGENYCRNMP